jgi:hypothetical protein
VARWRTPPSVEVFTGLAEHRIGLVSHSGFRILFGVTDRVRDEIFARPIRHEIELVRIIKMT